MLAPKNDGSLRFCDDYRKLNAVTNLDSYTVPRMDKCIDFLEEAVVFSALDANSGNRQAEVGDTDRDKVAFRSYHGRYSFIRMTFELKEPRNFSTGDGRCTVAAEMAVCLSVSRRHRRIFALTAWPQ